LRGRPHESARARTIDCLYDRSEISLSGTQTEEANEMPNFDSELLNIPTYDGAARAEAGAADPTSPACQMAKLSYKTALGVKLAFTALVYAVSLAAAAALVYAIFEIAKDGADLGAVVTGVSGVLASGGVVFLVKRMNMAERAEQKALQKVHDFCGENVANQLRG
jgi:hypothetical protein